jgi:hypothetical protein
LLLYLSRLTHISSFLLTGKATAERKKLPRFN